MAIPALDGRRLVAAPMAGVSTPELAAAVSDSGGLGLLAAGYLSAAAMTEEIGRYRALTSAPVAINLFTPQTDRSEELAGRLEGYREQLTATASRYGTEPGEPSYDDDAFDDKIDLLVADPVDLVTFTFGPVPESSVARLQRVGTSVGFTVTSAAEARQAAALGADLLVAQGSGAGGHRGTWNVSDQPNDDDAATVTAQVLAATGLPTVATGGVAGAEDVTRLLDAGADAVAVGTLLLPAEESRASAAHREALTSGRFTETRVTRAFSGRPARGLVNDFIREHDAQAPSAYPNVHRMTRPIRSAAAAAGDPEGLALWAGTGHRSARPATAAQIVAALQL